ncbi:hypothetical protein [Methylobacterium sp. A54F]
MADYDRTREATVAELRVVTRRLQRSLLVTFKYRLVSQAQAAPVERGYAVWAKNGEKGPQPDVDVASFRAAIYNQAAAARQLDAFIRVSSVVAYELCQAAIRGFEAREITVPYMSLRGLIERTAHAAALANAIRSLTEALPSPDGPNLPLLNVADKIGKALYGTKIDWQKLREVGFGESKESVAYVHKDMTMDVSARSILSAIDKLDKKIPGLRISYDTLCEYLHPNVGDLYSATARSYSLLDGYGTRHIIRELGLGPKDLSTAPDLEHVMSGVLAVCCEMLRELPDAIDELQTTSWAANIFAMKYAHRIRKLYRHYFQKNDFCPCLSGLRVRDCKRIT